MAAGTDSTPRSGPARAWGPALEAARRRDLPSARERIEVVRSAPPAFPGAHELLEGLCLVESGDAEPESVALAVERLTRARALDPSNVLAPHALALALMRAGRNREARELFERHRLPHDLNLLACVALRIEADLRAADVSPPADWPAWPGWLARPADPEAAEKPGDEEGELRADAAVPQLKVRRTPSGGMSKILAAMEADYFAFDYASVLRRGYEGMETGEDCDELHLIAGVACEEAGDTDRGRAHLSRALSLEPKNYMARAHLARIYARLGWLELAADLWRSLPIEGPDDSGRHYHLAIAHATLGDRAAAHTAMMTALRDFFIDTREFYIERAWQRWKRLNAGA